MQIFLAQVPKFLKSLQTYLRFRKYLQPKIRFFHVCRFNSDIYPRHYFTTLLRLQVVEQNSSNYLIILDTNHQALTKAKSFVARNLQSFYMLHKILKVNLQT